MLIHLPCLIHLMAFIVLVATGFVIFAFLLKTLAGFSLVEHLSQFRVVLLYFLISAREHISSISWTSYFTYLDVCLLIPLWHKGKVESYNYRQPSKEEVHLRVLSLPSRGDGRQSAELELLRHRETVQSPEGRWCKALQMSLIVFKLLFTLSCQNFWSVHCLIRCIIFVNDKHLLLNHSVIW